MALPKILYLGCIVFFLALAVVEATPPGIANNPSHASCQIKKYKMCYNLVHVCPKFCPNGCTVECASCKPICIGSTSPSPPENVTPPSSDDVDGKDKGGKGGGDDGKGKGGNGDDDGKDKGGTPPAPYTPPTPTTPTPYTPPTPVYSPPPPTPTPSPPTPTPSPPTPTPSPPTPSPPTPTPSPPTPTPSPPIYSPPPPPTPSPPTPTPSPPTPTPSPPIYSPPPPPTPSPPTPTPSPPTPTPSPPIYSPPPPPTPSPPTPTPSPPTPTPSPPIYSPPPPPPPSPPTPTPSPPMYSPPPPVTPSPPTPTPYTPPPPTPSTPTPPSSDVDARKRKRCKNKNYPSCYGVEHVCPANCPETCSVDCNTCKPVCGCDYPGAVCQDPRFIGGDGITFYFHGKKDKDFCLVTDPNFQINAHFIGKRNPKMTRDFTWVQSIGIMFDTHRLYIGAQKTSTWNDANDRLTLTFDSTPIYLQESQGFTWQSATTPRVTVTRTSDTNDVVVEIEGKVKVSVKVVPITEEESRVHNYEISKEDCFAHLDLGFKFESLSQQVDGVLGKTYRNEYVSRVNMGVSMPVVGGEREFATSSLFATDCKASRFEQGGSFAAALEDLSSIKCGSGMDGEGVVCKR